MEQRRPSWTPPGQPQRHDPLPGFLRLPARAWARLSPRGRRIVVAAALIAVAAIAVAWPYVERDKQAGEDARAAEAEARRAARVAELREDQRPRRAVLPATALRRIQSAGGLTDDGAAELAGAHLATAIEADVRSRIAAGKLEGPLAGATCDPVKVRSTGGANYNCFSLSKRQRTGERVFDIGYRFSARVDLPSKLTWCKENPRPLHPTSHVISLPISPECR
jgi:hypothetical protein